MGIEIDILNGDASWPLVSSLHEAVWTPEVLARLPWGRLAFARADLRVLVRSEDGDVLCHAGLYRRTLTWNGRKMKVGGIGDVMTRPDSRRHGFATIALNAAIRTFKDEGSASFAMLFCETALVPFYEARGFRQFEGELYAEQPNAGTVRIDQFAPMVHDIGRAPRNGVIDLCGLPW